jgi:hypothetical protein
MIMGLDMYLTKHIFVGAEYEHRNVQGSVDISVGGKKLPVKFEKISKIIESAGYWRKANHIHAWFVENVQDGKDDCQEYYVSQEKLKELLSLVEIVLADHSLANSILPTQSGFFFGGTEYDEWYFSDLELTKTILDNALNDDGYGEFVYQSSW